MIQKAKNPARNSSGPPGIPATDEHPQPNGASLLPKLVKVITRPGIDRAKLFESATGRTVYAYSVYAEDTSKLVREDVHGNKSVGRLVNGRFRVHRVLSKV